MNYACGSCGYTVDPNCETCKGEGEIPEPKKLTRSFNDLTQLIGAESMLHDTDIGTAVSEICKAEDEEWLCQTRTLTLSATRDLTIDGQPVVPGPAWAAELPHPTSQQNGIYTVSTGKWERPLTDGDRVLVTNQPDPKNDGVYVVGSGTMSHVPYSGATMEYAKLDELKRHSNRNRSGNAIPINKSKEKNRKKAKMARKARKARK